ncbi:MAG: RNA polymerase sigma factor [Odoribacteraceae bacterium]|jgi:RNA polymerase sigma-70 factor (ECF subfamily)|nr:RNA polymerase sigma factor [Odoribacteraceae bacterium]
MNREQYNRAVDRFSDALYRFVLGLCRSREIAEDVVQDSYMKLWELLSAVDGDKVKAFLFTTAYRRAIDILRRERKFADVESLEERGGTRNPEHVDLQQVLNAALDALPTVQRTIVLLRDYEGYSYKEIAEITGVAENNVKVYLFRARVAMKTSIGSPDKVV